MAWTNPSDKTTGDVVTAAAWNALLGTTGSLAQTAAAKVTTNGDIVYATAANTLVRLGIGSTSEVLTVTGGVPVWAAATSESVFDGIRTLFRANRRLVAEWAPAALGTAAGPAALVSQAASTGFSLWTNGVAGDIMATLTGEPYHGFSTAAANGGAGIWPTTSAGTGAVFANISPAKSPRMYGRVKLPAASASLTYWQFGFFTVLSAQNGAYFRLTTTGNLFAVTRQAGVETTTDLGAYSRTTIIGLEVESVDAGVTWVFRNQAGTVLATHTTNVPTAATALVYGCSGNTSAAVPWGIASARVEGTFA